MGIHYQKPHLGLCSLLFCATRLDVDDDNVVVAD